MIVCVCVRVRACVCVCLHACMHHTFLCVTCYTDRIINTVQCELLADENFGEFLIRNFWHINLWHIPA